MKATKTYLEAIFPALKGAKEPPHPSTLKDDVRGDLAKRQVWYDDDEIAEYNEINGSRVLCILDRYESAIASFDSGRTGDKGSAITAGIQSDLYMLFIRADEYNGNPRIGQEIQVNGRKLFIRDAVLYGGVYEITMKAGVPR